MSPTRRTSRPLTSRRAGRLIVVAGALAALGACASGGAAPDPAPAPAPSPSGSAGAGAPGAATQAAAWPVRTREHVDLWLHGLAMLVDDTARVPLFRPGYREELRAAHVRAGVTTRLDAERDRLRERFATSPRLPLDAQFIPFSFDSWATLRPAIEGFLQANGDPQRARDQEGAQAIAFLGSVFRTAADREWLRVFAGALDDESTRFYHGYWTDAQRSRSAALNAVESAWRSELLPKLQRFLDNTQQRGGELLLSLPLGGEGRTQSAGARRNVVTTGLPASAALANEALFTAVHEIVGALAGPVVADNTSPADQRAGLSERYVSSAQVRGGFLLLQRVAPSMAAGYARYYLGLVRGRATAADPAAALAEAFPLPAGLIEALARQIDVTLGGI